MGRRPDGRPGLDPGHPAALTAPLDLLQRSSYVRAHQRTLPSAAPHRPLRHHGSRCCDHPPGPRRMQQHDHEHREHHGQHGSQPRAGHPRRGGFDLCRPVLRPGLHPIPSAAPGGHRELFRRGQQRGHRRDQRPAGRLRRLRRAHERQRASRRPRRPGHPGTRRPGRRRRGLQPQPPGRRPAAPDRPGPRRHLPRADHPLERPGHHRPQPGQHPPGRVDHSRAPLRRQRHHLHLQQLPVQHRPRLGRQGRHRQDAQLAGLARAPKATAV